MKKILMFPGAFNPPHYGHVRALETALANIAFDEVWIVPSGNRDDKDISISYEDRRKLGNLFVEYLRGKIDVPVKLLTDELDDSSGRQTQEILRDIRKQANGKVMQLIGMDGFLNLWDKADKDELFVVVGRAGYELPSDVAIGDNSIVLNNESQPDISSTRIRAMIRENNPDYKNLLPPSIVEYIEKHDLYKS